MSAVVLRNGTCCTLEPSVLGIMDLRVAGGRVVARGHPLPVEEGDEVIDLSGKLILPGLVCAHTHLYSSLSRGMPFPDSTPVDFPDRLRKIWWRLDRALDAGVIYESARAGALEALHCGVTTIVDHHASPNAISGSLSTIEQALEEVGVRGVLCYETSDREGLVRRDAALEENESFLRQPHRLCRGLVGAHASFTLTDESLHRLGDLARRYGSGVHIHLAEDRADGEQTQGRYGRSIVERFEQFGLIRPRSVFAHAVDLSEAEFAGLRGAGVWLVHNPRSNMNNSVGHAQVELFGERAVLGTDGFPADMFEEARVAYLKLEESRRTGQDVGNLSRAVALLRNSQRLAAEIYGEKFGALDPGAPADLIVLNYIPPTPLTTRTLPAHLLFGIRSGSVESSMVNGNWVLWNGKCVTVDEDDAAGAARAAAMRLWSTMNDLAP